LEVWLTPLLCVRGNPLAPLSESLPRPDRSRRLDRSAPEGTRHLGVWIQSSGDIARPPYPDIAASTALVHRFPPFTTRSSAGWHLFLGDQRCLPRSRRGAGC